MRAAVLYDVDDVRIEERAVPELRDGEVLVRTAASGICSGDVMAWYIRRKAPLVLGHEPAGIVAAAPAATPRFRVGDRVFVHHHAPCFECRACRRGEHVQCTTWRATKIEPGGIAEYFRVSRENQRDTLHAAARACRFAMRRSSSRSPAWSSRCGAAALESGDRLYVIGLGVMGLLHVLVGAALGAEVFGSDFIEHRRALAQQQRSDRLSSRRCRARPTRRCRRRDLRPRHDARDAGCGRRGRGRRNRRDVHAAFRPTLR